MENTYLYALERNTQRGRANKIPASYLCACEPTAAERECLCRLGLGVATEGVEYLEKHTDRASGEMWRKWRVELRAESGEVVGSVDRDQRDLCVADCAAMADD